MRDNKHIRGQCHVNGLNHLHDTLLWIVLVCYNILDPNIYLFDPQILEWLSKSRTWNSIKTHKCQYILRHFEPENPPEQPSVEFPQIARNGPKSMILDIEGHSKKYSPICHKYTIDNCSC